MRSFVSAARTRFLTATTIASLALLAFASTAFAQISGTKNIPGDYATLAAAITDLNTQGVGVGGVTLNLVAGNPQTAPAGGYVVGGAGSLVLTTSSAANPIVIQGNANTITASGALTVGALTDALFKLVGADWVTITGFTLQENAANTVATPAASNTMTEWGVALLYVTTADGAQNNTIQNNTITLVRTYTNTFGVYSNVRHSSTAIATTADIVNATTAPNSGNRVYGNVISNVNMGVTFIGSGTAANQDVGNDVGGASAATGNIISNWGGAGALSGYISNSGTSYCIFMNHQKGDNVSFNTLTSAAVSGTAVTFRGIVKDYTTAQPTGTFTSNITNNTVTMTSGFTSGTFQGIASASLTALATATINIDNNTLLNCAMTGAASSSSFTGILNGSAPGSLSISGNILRGMTSTATTGTFTGISNTGPVVNAINISNNQIGNASGGAITFSAATTSAAVVTGITSTAGAATATRTISGNDFRGIVHSVVSAAPHTYINYANATSVTSNINNNTFTNLNVNTTASVTFINRTGNLAATGVENVNNNSIVTAFNKGGAGNTVTFFGANASSVNGAVMTNNLNNFSNVTVTGATTIAGWANTEGASSINGPTKTITNNTFNNIIGGTNATTAMAVDFSGPNTLVSTNAITNITAGGAITGLSLGTSNAATLTATQNLIDPITSSGASAVTGISTGGLGTVISKNKIYDLSGTNAASTVNGILVITGALSTNIQNNLIGNLTVTTASGADMVRGISSTSTTAASSILLSYNTIYLNATSSGANFGSSGVFHTVNATATTAALTMRDNIITNLSTPNGTGVTAAYRRSGTALNNYNTASNNNLLYGGAPSASRLLFFDGTNSDQALTTYKTRVSPADGASVTENPTFLSTTGSSPNFLHIDPSIATQIESGGTPVGGITDDFDGNARNVTTPDIGADEGNFTLADFNGPAISYTPLTGSSGLVTRSFTAVTATDPSGVDGTLGTRPRVYYKKSTDANTVVDNTSGTNGWKYAEGNGSSSPFDFTIDYSLLFGGSVSVGDVVQYFVDAQDLAGTPNVGINSGIFATTPTSVNLVAGNFPITGTIRSYTIVDVPLNGDYTVGLTLFNQANGTDVTLERRVRTVAKDFLEPVAQVPQLNAGKANTEVFLSDQLAWTKVTREVEEVSWVPMSNGQEFKGPLYVKRSEKADIPPVVQAGVYATITAAVNDLNARGVSGPVRFLLLDTTYPTETLPITVNVPGVDAPTAANPVTIKPNTGVVASVSGAAAGTVIFKVFNTNYITIDGSNTLAGTTRDLTIENTSVTTPSVVWFGSNGTTPITNGTLKNCIIRNGVNTASAVFISDGAVAGNAGFFSNMEVRNNKVERAFIGILATGGTVPQQGSNVTYADNELNSAGANAIRFIGLYMQGINGATVSGNTISNLNTASDENDTGIWLASGTINATASQNTVSNIGYTGVNAFAPFGINVTPGVAASNVNVTRNTVTNISTAGGTAVRGIASIAAGSADIVIQRNNVSGISNTNTNTFGAYGIDIAAGNNFTIKNNFVSDVKFNMSGGAAFSTQFGIFGIRVGLGSNHVIDDNSVNMFGALPGTTNTSLLSAALCIVATTSTGCDVRNNLLVNTITGGSTSIAHVSAALPSGGTSAMGLTWNNNAYYSGPSATTQGIGQVGTTPGTGFFLAGNFNPALTTPANNLRSVTSTLSPGGLNDNASLASTTAAPITSNTDLHILTNTLSPVSNAGVSVAGITDDIDGDVRTATPDIGADEFTIYTLTTSVTGIGSVTATPSQTAYAAGAVVSLTAVPGPCQEFTGWSGDASGNTNPLSVTMNSNLNIVANFAPINYTITASAGTGGAISPNGAVVVACGTDQTFTITPNACFNILDVLVDNVSVGAVPTYTFTNVQAAHTIAATFVANGVTYTITASAGAGGSISPTGAVVVACGADQAFTITPDACFTVQDVLVDNVSVGAVTSYNFPNVQANHTIAATFVSNGATYTITASAGPGGSISPTGAVVVACGANQSFTITPNACNVILDVLVDNVSVGAVPTYTFTNVTAAHTIAATFASNGQTYTITASAGPGGAISPNGAVVVACGGNQSFTITPNACFNVLDVTVDAVSVGAVTNYTFTDVQANHTIAATFVSNGVTYTITASAGPGGSITPSGAVSVACGANQSFTITPNACFNVLDVTVDAVSVGAVANYTFTDVQASHTIAASFVSNGQTYTITSTTGPGGTISPLGAVVVACGANQSFTITPNACFNVQDVLVDAVSVGAVTNYTFTDVQANHTIAATFVSNGATYTITATAGPGGSIAPSGAVVVACGANQTFNITAESCYSIGDVLVDNVSVGAVPSYTFTNVTAAHTISVSFVSNGPPSVTVISPNGAETLIIGSNFALDWLATDNVGVTCVDLYLSRSGPSGPWETIATCVPNSPPYNWLATGPQTTNAIFRVDAHDAAGCVGTDQSNAEFEIKDLVTATVVALFQANPVNDGVRVEWRINDTQLLPQARVQRSEIEVGPFAPVDAIPVTENGNVVVLDRAVLPGRDYFYRLEATTNSGQVVNMGTVMATAGVPIEKFAIEKVGPNPTSGSAVIGFAIPRQAPIRLSVYDAQGREVAVLANGQYAPGRYSVTWSGEGRSGRLSAGMYFIRFQTPELLQTRRLVLKR